MTVKKMFESISKDILFRTYFYAIESENVYQKSGSIYDLSDEYLNAEAKDYKIDYEACGGLGCITVSF